MNRRVMPFEITVPDELGMLTNAFLVAGFDLFLVGGAVRDAVMGNVPKDYDVATNALPTDVIDIVKTMTGWTMNEVGISFGVVRAKMNDHEFEIATFRTDIGEGRRPDSVEFTTIENDVMRRDLTINALFYDLHKHEVVDLVGGLDDIKTMTIRTVGLPIDRFREDRLRVLRTIRLAARFDWDIDVNATLEIMSDNNLDGVSPERIRDEFVKGVASSKSPGLFVKKLLCQFRMSARVFPGLVIDFWTPPSRNVVVTLANILKFNETSTVTKRLNELKYTATEVAQVTFLLDFSTLSADNAFRLKKRAKQCHISDDVIREFSYLDTMTYSLVNAFLKFETSVSGDDVLARGFSGKDVGIEIDRLETAAFKKLHSDVLYEPRFVA